MLLTTVHHKQEKNTVHCRNIPKLQPVPKDLKLFSLAMSECEMDVLLTILEVFTHTMDKYNLTLCHGWEIPTRDIETPWTYPLGR